MIGMTLDVWGKQQPRGQWELPVAPWRHPVVCCPGTLRQVAQYARQKCPPDQGNRLG